MYHFSPIADARCFMSHPQLAFSLVFSRVWWNALANEGIARNVAGENNLRPIDPYCGLAVQRAPCWGGSGLRGVAGSLYRPVWRGYSVVDLFHKDWPIACSEIGAGTVLGRRIQR